MKFVKQVSKFKMLSSAFSALFAMLLLLSCSKNVAEMPSQSNPEVSRSNQSSAEVSNSEEVVPFDRTLFVPCGNGGAGQEVTLTGSLKIGEHIIYNSRGFTLNYNVVAQGVTGVGLSTGEKFEASGGNKGTITGEFGEVGQYTRVFREQLRIIGQHSVFKVLYKTKITITPDGKVTTSIEEETVDCNM